jgi:hypothetical protein
VRTVAEGAKQQSSQNLILCKLCKFTQVRALFSLTGARFEMKSKYKVGFAV